MHKQAQEFIFSVSQIFPEYFNNVSVLDCGSLDINGNNRWAFKNCKYLGIDVAAGNNVDIICLVHQFKPSKQFDVVISTEMLEHDRYWRESLNNVISLLKPNGLLLFTCATTGRGVHGIERVRPEENPELYRTNYYRNLTEEDIRLAIDMNSFKDYRFSVERQHCDLRFWGVKK